MLRMGASRVLSGSDIRKWLLVAGCIFAFSATVHVLANGWLRGEQHPDLLVESSRVALSLAHGDGFQNPLVLKESGPTAHVAPVYPYLYGAVLRAFGTGVQAAWVVRLLTIGANALLWSMMLIFVKVWGLQQRVGWISAITGGLLPIPGSCFKWESILAGLLLLGCACLTGICVLRPHATKLWIATGVVWGSSFLVMPVLVAVWLGWLLLIWWLVGGQAGWRLLLLAVVPVLMTAPWIVRNYKIFHTFVFVRDNLGLELASSNSDCAGPWIKQNARSGCLALTHPSVNLELARRFAAEGEIAFNANRMAMAITWIRQNRTRFLMLCAERARYFWFPPVDRAEGDFAAVNNLIVGALTLFSLPGLWLLWRENARCGAFVVSGLLLFPAIFYLLQLDVRYRYPILWATILGTAFLLSFLMEIVLRLPKQGPGTTAR
jgi:hypothetical protein